MAADPLKLGEAGEWAGEWWLPDDPGLRMPGILRYDAKGGLSLSLIGAFDDRITSQPAPGVTAVHEGTKTWEIIHGVADQSEITLLGCIPTGTKRELFARVESPDIQTVTVAEAIVGVHVRGEEEETFSMAEVSIEDLGLWAASSVFEGFIGATDGKIDGSGRISVSPVEVQSVTVDGTEYRLAHTHTLPFFDQRKGETVGRMRDTTSIQVVPARPFSLRAAQRAASLVQDLIALATHRAAGLLWLRLEIAGTETAPSVGRTIRGQHADVLYGPAAIGSHDARAVDQHRVFFTCDTLPFDAVMREWCGAYARLRAAINMILGLRYAPARFIENNLLTAVGAAEVLHRGLCADEKPLLGSEFKAMRDAMLAQVPAEHRDRFKGAIRNDPTLRDRLHVLAARPDREAIAHIVPDIDLWAKVATRARNDLAHEGTTDNHSVEELVAIVDVTSAVVILNVLHELGLTAERQREIVRRHPQLRATARAAREWLINSDSKS